MYSLCSRVKIGDSSSLNWTVKVQENRTVCW